MNFNIETYSDIGKRIDNQDSLGYKLINGNILISCIADGVGGKQGGKIASQLCVDEFIRETENNAYTKIDLKKILLKIHESILRTSKESINLGMASTFTGLIIKNDKLKGIHTGDTRICILRGNGIKQITKDQTEVARLVREGLISFEEAKKYPRRNIIESALGVIDRELDLYEFEFDLELNDRIMMTTDGVHENISKKELRDISLKSKTPIDFINNIKEILSLREPKDNNSIVIITTI